MNNNITSVAFCAVCHERARMTWSTRCAACIDDELIEPTVVVQDAWHEANLADNDDQVIAPGCLSVSTDEDIHRSIEALIGEIRGLSDAELDCYSDMAELSRERSAYESDDEYAAALDEAARSLNIIHGKLAWRAYALAESVAHVRQGRPFTAWPEPRTYAPLNDDEPF